MNTPEYRLYYDGPKDDMPKYIMADKKIIWYNDRAIFGSVPRPAVGGYIKFPNTHQYPGTWSNAESIEPKALAEFMIENGIF